MQFNSESFKVVWYTYMVIIMYITNTIIIKVFGQISKKFEPGDAMQ